ncbi:hypothetical protein [Lysinibacillus sp. YS11]|uniref:hypothetical protein n=1 Tax=Lysinibacillus sp. YS11 TaxID=2072025 RepID=UPI001315A595|nr:hypothetical protein [Lysinibacillus sp. YS11]
MMEGEGMDKKYRYFVSFSHNTGFANAEIRRTTPIQNIGDIVEEGRNLERKNYFPDKSVVIISFQLFE